MKGTFTLILTITLASVFAWYMSPEITTNLLAFRGVDLLQGKFWTPFTAIFVHGDLVHLIGNILFLYIFGTTLERNLGSRKFLVAFFIGGVFSFILGILFYGFVTVMIGASAAIFTIMAIVMLTEPLKFSWFFLMPLGLLALLYLLFNIIAIQYAEGGSIGYAAHILGFLIGLPFGISWSQGEWFRNLLITLLLVIIYLTMLVALSYFFGIHLLGI